MKYPAITRLAAFVAAAILISTPPALGDGLSAVQAGPERLDSLIGDYGPPVLLGKKLLAANQPQNKSDYEIIYGNGSAMGYTLSHGNLVPNADSVYVGGIVQVRDVDYQIDYRQGIVTFMRPILPSEYIIVYYSFASGDTGSRTMLNSNRMSLVGRDRAMVDFTYARRAVTRDNSDNLLPGFTTYGLHLDTKLGAKSTIKTILFSSHPDDVTDVFGTLDPAYHSATASLKPDKMVMHTGDFSFGSLKMQMTYQDVGPYFSGFMELRDSDSAAELNPRKLEYEKGMKRTGLTLTLPVATGAATSKPAGGLYWNTVEDPSGQFEAKGLDLTMGKVGVFAESRGSDPTFAKFAYLAYGSEWSDTALQIKRQFDPKATAAQVPYWDIYQTIYGTGIERNRYGMSYAAKTSSGWLQAVEIADQTGVIERYSFSFANAKYNLFGFTQSIDSSFAHLASLTDVEKAQFGMTPGVERTDVGGTYKLNGELDGTVTHSEFTSDTLSISTESIGIKGKNYDIKANFNDVSRITPIDPSAPVTTPDIREGRTVSVEAGMETTVFKSVAGLTNGKLKVRVSTEERTGENTSVSLQSGVAKGNLTLEYANLQTPYTPQVESRGFRFSSNPDPKKWLHFDVLYKNRADGPNDPYLVKSCSVTARLSSRANLTYSSYQNPEYYDAKVVSPIGAESLQFTAALRQNLNFVAYYRTYGYLAYKWGANSLNMALTGKLQSGAAFAAGLAHNVSLASPKDIQGKTVWVRYDRPVSAERYLRFSALVTKWEQPIAGLPGTRNFEARVDYQSSFRFLNR